MQKGVIAPPVTLWCLGFQITLHLGPITVEVKQSFFSVFKPNASSTYNDCGHKSSDCYLSKETKAMHALQKVVA